ncbi:MAG: STAS domain-containing protein [Halothiobacillaceae bacterium]|jgi:ABC-type transporter Mla MlaB component
MYHLQLPEDLLTDELPSVALQLEAVLVDSPEQIDIDASLLRYADTLGMQLLYAFARDARAQGKQVRWHHLAPEVAELARGLGMAALIHPATEDAHHGSA